MLSLWRVIVLTLPLAACGGQSPQAEWDPAEDIDVPWSTNKAPDTASEAPSGTETAAADGPLGDVRGKRGASIDFDVKDTDLHDALRLLAESADINIVVADTVTGRITLRVLRVPWQQVLQTIAKMKHLTLSQEGGIYYVR